MRIPKTCFFTLVLIFFTSMLPVHTVFAEQTAPATMDLNQAVQTALKENPQIKAGNWAVKAAKEGVSI